MDRTDKSIPASAGWLGGTGVLPFAGGTAAVVLRSEPLGVPAAEVLVAYGASILSFMGAVQWGLAISAAPAERRTGWLCVSVVPALIAWLTLLITPVVALLVQAAAFVGVFAVDRVAVAQGLAPPWYGRLRIVLTTCVVSLLLVSAASLTFLRG